MQRDSLVYNWQTEESAAPDNLADIVLFDNEEGQNLNPSVCSRTCYCLNLNWIFKCIINLRINALSTKPQECEETPTFIQKQYHSQSSYTEHNLMDVFIVKITNITIILDVKKVMT